MSLWKRILIGVAAFSLPFIFYGWMALIGKFLNIVIPWANKP